MRLHCNYETVKDLKDHEITAPGGIRIEFVEWPAPIAVPPVKPEFIITRATESAWTAGRAGMQYRDLIPGNLGGAVVASHIRTPLGGEVPDYVHYHRILFQMIYCKTGWARLVYEDQGLPFIMNAGDCVLQPPGIRHRVLETSPGFEVIEVGCPAVHETWRDHEIELPTRNHIPDRLFEGQRFVRHIASAVCSKDGPGGFEIEDTGFSKATNGLATVKILKGTGEASFSGKHSGEILFYYILDGNCRLTVSGSENYALTPGHSVVIPRDCDYRIDGTGSTKLLEVLISSPGRENN